MKKIIYLAVLLCGLATFAQDFPGEAVEMLDGKELKVKPLSERNKHVGYEGFYTDENCQKLYKKNSYYKSKSTALENKIFKVVSYKPKSGKYIITLSNEETGTIYFRYNPLAESSYEFEVVGGLVFPEGFFCKRIITDKIWNSTAAEYFYSRRTPCREDLCVWESGKDSFIFRILITEESDKKETGLTGVTLYLANGKEVSWPDEKVEVEPSGDYYNYKVAPRITESQFALLSESPIIKKRIGNKEKTVEDGKVIKEYIKCITKDKP